MPQPASSAAPVLRSRPVCPGASVHVHDVHCRACRGRHAGPAEWVPDTRIVLAYRGAFVYRAGRRAALADPNRALAFNAGDEYAIDHPADHGDRCLSIRFAPERLRELAGGDVDEAAQGERLRRRAWPVDAGAQWLAARLRACGSADQLRAEELALALARRILQPDPAARPRRAGPGRQRLLERTRLLLQEDPARRWTLGDLAARVGASPVYLTQSFSQVEGMPLYRYQTGLRLARALEQLPRADDLTALALAHGFSGHSQFTAAFRRAYGLTPSAARRALRAMMARPIGAGG
ncbi:AraC family transcriptional regulator [Luteimonas sp. RD2P54]|uniref:AraC family transcriptional regulator n=1 Tax=Luteimonas endophytica TaxID=3042023 RepID=A0ABT6JDW7_9GAMM|nr:AraC family transcriptional regulator [Luteimonas endophytica]MDH5824408.1 AraC family transcriptional regulator [Luteimonas endophytica]